jgi:fermentation-respiration switch protein FrsA (DUF1100 family)
VLLKTTLTLVVLAAGLVLLVRLIEPRFAFYPVAGESSTPAAFGIAHEALTIATADAEQLHGWRLAAQQRQAEPPARNLPRAHVVYFHGNGGNLSIWAPVLAGLARRGYAVTAFDYRGYGRSTGRPSERGLYRDVDAVIERFWNDDRPPGPVVYWGRSLGGAMAAYAAARRAPDAVILESAFPDVRSLLRGHPLLSLFALFSSYRFPAGEFLRQVQARVLVIHGDSDRIIPFSQGEALYEDIGGPKRFLRIRGGDHNDLTPADPDEYWTTVGEFIAGG